MRENRSLLQFQAFSNWVVFNIHVDGVGHLLRFEIVDPLWKYTKVTSHPYLNQHHFVSAKGSPPTLVGKNY